MPLSLRLATLTSGRSSVTSSDASPERPPLLLHILLALTDLIAQDPRKTHVQLVTYLKPGLRIDMTAEASLGIPGIQAGLGCEITLLDIALPMSHAENFMSKKNCFKMGLEISAMGGRFFAFFRVGYCPFCVNMDFTIFDWQGIEATFVFNFGQAMNCCKRCSTTCLYGVCNKVSTVSSL